MLGDKIGEENGQITGMKVVSTNPPTTEISFQATGQLLGVATNAFATYTSVMRPDGTIYGEGNGLITTADGEGATWKGSGVGVLTGEGMGAKYRGAIYYSTTSKKLAKLNSIAAIFEYEVDAEGKTHGITWEWS